MANTRADNQLESFIKQTEGHSFLLEIYRIINVMKRLTVADKSDLFIMTGIPQSSSSSTAYSTAYTVISAGWQRVTRTTQGN